MAGEYEAFNLKNDETSLQVSFFSMVELVSSFFP
jgi:hypothetical protein